MDETINETVEGFSHLWGELGKLLDEAEKGDETLKFREDISTVRHFWTQLGSVLHHVKSRNEEKEEVTE